MTEPEGPQDRQVSESQVSLRARVILDDPSKIGKYSCSAQDQSGNSGSAVLTMEEHYGGSGSSGYQPVYPHHNVQPGPQRKFLS